MTSFNKIVTLAVLFLTFSFVTAYGQYNSVNVIQQMEAAAQKGDVRAQVALGYRLSILGDQIAERDPEQAKALYTKAIHWFNLAAQKGHPFAEFMLGISCQYGKGVSVNLNDAIQFYTKAAEKGEPYSQLRLGLCYHNGIGVSQNSKEALKWFSRAANQNIPEAQYWLGYYFENGLCKSVAHPFEGGNLFEANTWYHRAADNGFYPAVDKAYRTDIMIQKIVDAQTDIDIINIINQNRQIKPEPIISSFPDLAQVYPDMYPSPSYLPTAPTPGNTNVLYDAGDPANINYYNTYPQTYPTPPSMNVPYDAADPANINHYNTYPQTYPMPPSTNAPYDAGAYTNPYYAYPSVY